MSHRNRKSDMRVGTQSFPAVGKTEDGKCVVAGVYDFHQTLGIPLDFLFAELCDRGYMPDWLDFYWRAMNNGMQHDRIVAKIIDPIEDAWGTDYASKICETLDSLHYSGVAAQVLEKYRRGT